MNKSDQGNRSPRGGRRLLLVAGVALTAVLMVVPMITTADTVQPQSGENNAQAQSSVQASTDQGSAQINGNQSSGQSGQSNSVNPQNPSQTLGGGSSAGATNQGSVGSQGAAGNEAAPQPGTSGTKGDSSNKAVTPQDSGVGPQGDDDVHKPQLQAMLSDNDRVDSVTDELRMDFVLRVGHGDVRPDCVPLAKPYNNANNRNTAKNAGRDGTGQCGLQFFYTYSFDGNHNASSLRRLSYMNTQFGNASSKPSDYKAAATEWAWNVDEYFTIENLKTSDDGKYDYLTISLEGDQDYPDNPSGSNQLGGLKYARGVYAVVNPKKAVDLGWCSNSLNNGCYTNTQALVQDTAHVTNIAADYPVYLYNTGCPGGSCSGPIAYVGYDDTAKLWTRGQANWGLRPDNGFNGQDFVNKTPAGTAPKQSFFTMWNNPGPNNDPCAYTASFYYEWFGLKDGKWVPATSITSHALASNGQNPTNPGTSPNSYKYDPNTGQFRSGSDQNYASYNDPDGDNADRTIMGDGPAQNADGSINFAKAKADQGLDGYFKLVTWPTSGDGSGNISSCLSTKKQGPNGLSMREVYNPLYGGGNENLGVTQDMADNHPDNAQYLMNLGWTVDTAYEGYDYKGFNPTTPVATTPTNPADTSGGIVPAANDPAHTPKIEKMLGYNNKVSADDDELRADFVLRVAHGDVDPGCTAMTNYWDKGTMLWTVDGVVQGIDKQDNCGLKLSYSYNGAGTQRPLHYLNTWKSDNQAQNTKTAQSIAAYWWARDVGDGEFNYYTIRDVTTKGAYDYLTVSVEADVDYPNSGDWGTSNRLGGTPQPLYIYAKTRNKSTGNDGAQVEVSSKNYPLRTYRRGCNGRNDSSQCDGPFAFVGYDETHPHLWSNGQANWGLITDTGAPAYSGLPNYGQNKSPDNVTQTAPKDSFFLRWVNPDLGRANSNVCSKVTKYYFQWFGLVNGRDWKPVTSLTPQAQSTNQAADGTIIPLWAPNAKLNEPGGLMARNADGSLAAAQNQDGSIDFGKVKADQPEFDGYYKLVTWPVSTTSSGNPAAASCSATQALKDVYNPLIDQANDAKGVSTNMAATDQSNAQSLIDKGWTVDTVYDNFTYKSGLESPAVSVDGIDIPHTKKEANGELTDGDNAKVKVSGTAKTVGYGTASVQLYMKFKDPSASTSGDIVADTTKIGAPISVVSPGDTPWSVDIPISNFKVPANVAKGDTYTFEAVLTSTQGQATAGPKDWSVDVTSPALTFDTTTYRKVSGKLTARDSHTDLTGTKVTVIWDSSDTSGTCRIPVTGDPTAGAAGDCKTSETTADAAGNWSLVPPSDVHSGIVRAFATDQATNESAIVKAKVPLAPMVRQLPITGSWLLWLLLAIAVLATADFVYRRYKKNAQLQSASAGRHSISNSGPRHTI
ncbi:hypothetical protein OZX72_09145 [Bifidobacterium sp. ESL0769]|uniref:hypothetical protein n=1 Tax=Bifidobacterium sp. ESL0769 TaxID=2983229 RepID=UPI0023F6A7D5|nr:hypothetical protein [Bifidobacterium sp. ESL0769]WEV67381.1 hypothetical protein OZX72_09145 [Bifidobacterium sp. ESL0769]